jgi:hypothetical protein
LRQGEGCVDGHPVHVRQLRTGQIRGGTTNQEPGHPPNVSARLSAGT